MASGVKEPMQSRLDGLVFSQKFLRVEDLIAARLADIASQAFVKAEHQMAAHAIELIRPPRGVKDRVTDLLAVGQLHQLLGIGPRAPEFLEGGLRGTPHRVSQCKRLISFRLRPETIPRSWMKRPRPRW